jgi:HJR/Mrr/RecB family endonuclease
LNPNLFEACIAALYKAKGYNVFLTPNSNDKGADVVVINQDDCFLIQAKQCKSNIGIEAIQEIYGAKNYYESKFKENFKLVVITNSDFSQAAMTLSKANNVILINRKDMHDLIESVEISIQDIYKIETQRMKNI